MRTNMLNPADSWSIASNTIFEHHFACVHSYGRTVKNLLLRKLQYYKRRLALRLLNMSRNARVVVAVILVSSPLSSKKGGWLTRTKCSFFRSGIWKMWNPSEKVSFQRWVVLWKGQKYTSWNLIFEEMKPPRPPSIVACPDAPDVEQSRSHRALKRTYAVAGRLIRSKPGRKLTSIVIWQT